MKQKIRQCGGADLDGSQGIVTDLTEILKVRQIKNLN